MLRILFIGSVTGGIAAAKLLCEEISELLALQLARGGCDVR